MPANGGTVDEEVKRNLRSVLLSKVGGVKLLNLQKDYKQFFGTPLPYKSFGFNSLIDLIQAIPNVAKIVLDHKDNQHKVFGVAEAGVLSYTNRTAKKAQFKPQPDQQVLTSTNMSGPLPKTAGERRERWRREMVPNINGYYALCFDRKSTFTRDDVNEVFSKYGDIVDLSFTERYVFVRYSDQEEALQALEDLHTSPTFGVRIPREKCNPRHVIKDNKGGHEGVSRNPSRRRDNEAGGDGKIEVFFSLPTTFTEERFREMLEGYSYLNIRFQNRIDKCFAHVAVANRDDMETLIVDHHHAKLDDYTLIVQQAFAEQGKHSKTEDACLIQNLAKRGNVGIPVSVDQVNSMSPRSSSSTDSQGRPGQGRHMVHGAGDGDNRRVVRRDNPRQEDLQHLQESSQGRHEALQYRQEAPQPHRVNQNLSQGAQGPPPLEGIPPPLEGLPDDLYEGSGDLHASVVASAIHSHNQYDQSEISSAYDRQPHQSAVGYQGDRRNQEYNYISPKTHTADDLFWLYVANFAYGTSEADLFELFEPYGCIKVNLKNTNDFSRRQYAFLGFKCLEDAEAAYVDGYAYEVDGYKLWVSRRYSVIVDDEDYEEEEEVLEDFGNIKISVKTDDSATRREVLIDRTEGETPYREGFQSKSSGNRFYEEDSYQGYPGEEYGDGRAYRGRGRQGGGYGHHQYQRRYHNEQPTYQRYEQSSYNEEPQDQRYSQNQPERAGQGARGQQQGSYHGNQTYERDSYREKSPYGQDPHGSEKSRWDESRGRGSQRGYRPSNGNERHNYPSYGASDGDTRPSGRGINTSNRDTRPGGRGTGPSGRPYDHSDRPSGRDAYKETPRSIHSSSDTRPQYQENRGQQAFSFERGGRQQQYTGNRGGQGHRLEGQSPPEGRGPQGQGSHQWSAPPTKGPPPLEKVAPPKGQLGSQSGTPVNMRKPNLQATLDAVFGGQELRTRAREFSANGIASVVVTHIEENSPQYVWGQVYGESELDTEFATMIERLSQEGDSYPPLTQQQPYGVAHCQGEWCRAHVISWTGRGAEVFYVDYGNSEEVEHSKLKAAPADIWRVPFRLVPLKFTDNVNTQDFLLQRVDMKLSDARPEEAVMEARHVQ